MFMAGVNLLVQKSLNPEAREFIPNRSNQNTRLIILPSTTFNNSSHYYYCTRPPPPPLLFFQNLNYNFHDHHHYSTSTTTTTTTPPSPYHHTYTTTLVPDHPSSLYTTNPTYPAQPHDHCLVGPAKVDPKGYSRKERRGHYSNKSLYRRNGGRPGQAKFNNRYDFSDYARKSQPKQRHPMVPVEEDGGNTTVMIRNIPNRFTREMVMDFLDDHCMVENQKAKQLIKNGDAAAEVEAEAESIVSAFNFLYLPMDFKSGVNKGYAFVNFTDPRAAWKFYLSAHNQPWGAFQTSKIRQIAFARVQGKEELERHFKSTNFPCEGQHEHQYLPVCFSPARDGSKEMVNQRTVGRCTKPGQNACMALT